MWVRQSGWQNSMQWLNIHELRIGADPGLLNLKVTDALKRQNLSPLELAQFIRRRVDDGEANAEIDSDLITGCLALTDQPRGRSMAAKYAARSSRADNARTWPTY